MAASIGPTQEHIIARVHHFLRLDDHYNANEALKDVEEPMHATLKKLIDRKQLAESVAD